MDRFNQMGNEELAVELGKLTRVAMDNKPPSIRSFPTTIEESARRELEQIISFLPERLRMMAKAGFCQDKIFVSGSVSGDLLINYCESIGLRAEQPEFEFYVRISWSVPGK